MKSHRVIYFGLAIIALCMLVLSGCSFSTPTSQEAVPTNSPLFAKVEVVVSTMTPEPQASPVPTEVAGVGGVPDGFEDAATPVLTPVTPAEAAQIEAVLVKDTPSRVFEFCPQSGSPDQNAFFGPYRIDGVTFEYLVVFTESHGAPSPDDKYVCGMASDENWLLVGTVALKGQDNGADVFEISGLDGQTYADGAPYGDKWSKITFVLYPEGGSILTQ